tara:strand:+ start:48 stop:389 length:342 start_codon:yes stop_codon:yes gene_type:complete
MKLLLNEICCSRSGDKGKNSNVGLIFDNKEIYNWAKEKLTDDLIKKYYKDLVKGKVVRYELDNILSLNFILFDSLGGGGSESLLNDCQGKTHGQLILMMEIDFPDKLKEFINA